MYELVAEILDTVNSWPEKQHYKFQAMECKSVHISYTVGIPYLTCKHYLQMLPVEKLLIPQHSDEGIYYLITSKGEEYLKIFGMIQDDLQPIPTEDELLISVEF